MTLRFGGGERIQRGRGVGGLLKLPRSVFNPFSERKSTNNNVGYYDNCRTCQQYGRVLHEIEKGYDNKGFVSDEGGLETENPILKFKGAEILQRGRGIGGLLRLAKSIFSPLLRSIGKTAVKAATSQTGQKALEVLKKQTINSGLNMMTDAVKGRNLKESGKREVNNYKDQLVRLFNSKVAEREDEGSSRKKKIPRRKVRFVPK